jgi:hypothetical protein
LFQQRHKPPSSTFLRTERSFLGDLTIPPGCGLDRALHPDTGLTDGWRKKSGSA